MKNGYPPPVTSTRWGSRTKRIVVMVTLLFMGLFVFSLVEILPLVIAATLLSYLLSPLVNFIEKNILSILPFHARSLAVVMSFVTVFGVFVLAGVLIVPVLINQIADVGEAIPRFVEASEAELEHMLSKPIMINGSPVTIGGEPVILMDRFTEITKNDPANGGLVNLENFDIFQVLGSFLGSLGSLTGPAFTLLGGALDAIINLTFLLVIMFYFMRDGEQFMQRFVNLIPQSYEGDARRLLYELGIIWNAYLRGQLILSGSVGMAVYIAALVLGLPNAPIFGLLAGILEFIPNLGPFIALVPAATIALFSESTTFAFLSGIPYALVVILVWTGIQNLEAFFLVPRVMGGSLNLHPVVVILAVIAGASIAGVLGIILAAPFTASFRLIAMYIYGKVFDTNPFPNPEPGIEEARQGYLVRYWFVLRRFGPRRGLKIFQLRQTSQESEQEIIP